MAAERRSDKEDALLAENAKDKEYVTKNILDYFADSQES